MRKMVFEVCSIINTRFPDKPNEDYCLCDENLGLVIVLDGVSRDKENGKYPNPSPARIASEIFANAVRELIANMEGDQLIKEESVFECFRRGNDAIYNYNRRNYAGDFLPGTVGIVLIIRNNKAIYGYIGDCIGLKIHNSTKLFFTREQTAEIAKYGKKFTARQIRNEICNHKEHPYAYGVLDGRNGALDFVETGSFQIDGDEIILLASDGLKEVIEKMDASQLRLLSVESIASSSMGRTNRDDKTVCRISAAN